MQQTGRYGESEIVVDLTDEQMLYRMSWLRSRLIWCDPDCTIGRELRDPHFWIIVSTDGINANPKLPVIAVPIVSHRKTTHIGASDLEVKEEESPTKSAAIVRCGQIRVLDRSRRDRAQSKIGKCCSDALMRRIDEKLLEVLAIKAALDSVDETQ
jgi:mRNA-degrading endonuclease toxin of MazEF toxin-antitoxin module